MPDKKPRTPIIRSKGYSTDHLIWSLDDRELLAHMGVPRAVSPYAIAQKDGPFPAEVEFWLEHLPYIFRPAHDLQDEKPSLYAKGLIFYGPSGTRKTTTASALLLRVIRLGIRNSDPDLVNLTWHGWCMGRFVDWQDASELFRKAVSSEKHAERAEALRTEMSPGGPVERHGDFLVIDDISRERGTEFNSGELHRLIRHRYNIGRPTILTTNYYQDQWDDVYDLPMSAFMKRSFIGVEFKP